MRLLLDTHVWLWMLTAPERLSAAGRDHLEDAENSLYLSSASSWELAIKYELGKIQLPEPPRVFVPTRLQRDGVLELPVHHHHATGVAGLPAHHRDPFDRLLIAQARAEGMRLLTADCQLAAYEVDLAFA